MARSAEQQKIYNKERYIGRKASGMAQAYILNLLRQDLEIHNEGGKNFKPILQATKVTGKMGDYRLLGLNFTSNKAGFINHFGFKGVRSATTVLLSHSRYEKSATRRRSHSVSLPSQKFFEDIYNKSGALDYLIKALSETRAEAIEASLRGLIVQLNTQDDGR